MSGTRARCSRRPNNQSCQLLLSTGCYPRIADVRALPRHAVEQRPWGGSNDNRS